MIKIVMDSAGDIPAEWIDEFDINIIPINIHFKEKTYLQGVDLSDEEFYQLVDKSKIIPKTSQPTPAQFINFYQKIAQPGDNILSIHVTKKLSGTCESAEMAARELEGKYRVIPFDSAAGSVAIGYMCREARMMEKSGAPLEQIMARLEDIRKQVQIILTLETLDYARMSGRVKALQAALASLLNVKPIIELKDGVLDMVEKVRTRSKSIEYILEKARIKAGNQLVNAAVVHARDPRSGQSLLEQVKTVLNCKMLILSTLSIGVAANLGPGTVGIITYPAPEG